ncbi:pteridine-dependent deoxygenase like protein [Methyloradius palustris]|uniref:Pteridine-dependent deoxygenase like protein n=1 Tax=Methyloradius palustris TaxID=2778876 RepID=A0A8D5G8J3_9PROT|nr:pteridine-dependent deoxygenase like protein [Methyloradius palustris]
MGGIAFSDARNQAGSEIANFPFALVNMPVLEGGGLASEIWMSDHKVRHAQRGLIRYSYDEDTLFGVLLMPQTGALEQITESAFAQIFSLLEGRGYTHIFRFWNYLADINGGDDEDESLERYRQFNLGRQNAFVASGREVSGNLPAACALGTADGPLTIAFMAGRTPTLSIENPRQMSAYQYPEQYGPRSPSFSRANLVSLSDAAHELTDTDQTLAQQKLLFISGTASIVGHETRHHSDVAAQTCETLVNIEAVIHEANKKTCTGEFSMTDLFYRVYVRHPTDLPAIRAEMEHVLGHSFKAVFVQADICRKDLLVEIEATAVSTIRLPEEQYA